MVDLDDFSKVNDDRGHLAGDAVLAAVVNRMRSQLRPYDAVGRFGGDEFLLVLVGCGLPQAQEVCQRVRLAVEGSAVEFRGGSTPMTISIGVTAFTPPAATTTEELVMRADRMLLQAKHGGKNSVVAS
jgi:diguanylate cyclase (GGDEF)-like protein